MIDAHLPELVIFLQALRATPQRLAAISAGVGPSRLINKTSVKDWSANDILAHLRACADVWGGCIQAMLDQDHPTIKYRSPRTYMRKTDYPKQDFHSSLEVFTHQRAALLQVLQALEAHDWERGGLFDDGHKLRKQTVFETVRRLAKHEAEHCEQIDSLFPGSKVDP